MKKPSKIFGDCDIDLLSNQYRFKIKKECDRIGTKVGEEYIGEKYKYDPYGKVYFPELDAFEYIYNLEFLSLEDKISFYK